MDEKNKKLKRIDKYIFSGLPKRRGRPPKPLPKGMFKLELYEDTITKLISKDQHHTVINLLESLYDPKNLLKKRLKRKRNTTQ